MRLSLLRQQSSVLCIMHLTELFCPWETTFLEETSQTKTGLAVDSVALTTCQVGYGLPNNKTSMMSTCDIFIDDNHVSLLWNPPLTNCSGKDKVPSL